MLNSSNSYALLQSVADVDTIQFDFISTAPSGLLFYADMVKKDLVVVILSIRSFTFKNVL